MTSELNYYTWQPYPQDVPIERRLRCSECGAPGEVVRYLHDEIIGPYTVFDSLSNNVRDLFTVYCTSCAEKAGYGTYKDRGVKPPHLDGLQRWLGHVLDHGDPEHLA
ncbi:MAG TPA: hypothetical protein VK662_04540 [Acidothermaceae bacterium]|jgi:hypothetical protein|nr:hypothetical protein [Acidothermaceae bacterium]